jgi:DNA-binding NarL/FixJ family response regulator
VAGRLPLRERLVVLEHGPGGGVGGEPVDGAVQARVARGSGEGEEEPGVTGRRGRVVEDVVRAVVALRLELAELVDDIAYDRLSVVLQAHDPDVLILDPSALDDLAAVRTLSLEHPRTHLVLLGQDQTTAECAQLLAFGASACLGKDTQARDVRNAIHLAARGLQVMPRGIHSAGVAAQGHSLLTRREGDVLHLLRQGHSNPRIALELNIGVETVRTHARGVYRKLGVSSRRALVALPALAAEAPTRALPAVQHPARRRVSSMAGPRRR